MHRLLAPMLAWGGLALSPLALQAQTQTWQRQGSPPPAGSQVVPENCQTASDGTITCGTRLEGSDGRRPPAHPRVDLFPQ